jgi:TonB family protein
MIDAESQPEADLAIAELSAPGNEPAREATSREDRRFYVGLALAILLHSLFFAGFYGAEPRTVGDPGGSKEAISVNFVTDAELRGLSAVLEAAREPPAPPAPPPTPPSPPPAETAAAAPPTPPSPPAVQPPDPAPKPPEPASTQAPAANPAPALEASVPDTALSLKPPEEREPRIEPRPAEPPKPEPPKPAQPAKPEPSRSAKLDLSPPAIFSPPSGSGGAGVQRPPGITRSGENDAFARGVVSALRRTMPQLNQTLGRVTVRITLDLDGSLVSTQVVRASNIAGLDRSVVFATRQTSYPFPPRNARSADLVFLITYIYQ